MTSQRSRDVTSPPIHDALQREARRLRMRRELQSNTLLQRRYLRLLSEQREQRRGKP